MLMKPTRARACVRDMRACERARSRKSVYKWIDLTQTNVVYVQMAFMWLAVVVVVRGLVVLVRVCVECVAQSISPQR